MKLALLDHVEKLRRAAFDDTNLDVRMLAPIAIQHRRDDALHRHGRGAYRELPAAALAQRLGARHEGLGFGEHVAAVGEQAHA